jgi:hypothetical protein
MTARLSDGLREIADLLDKHPEIQQAARFKGQHSDLMLFVDSPVVLAELAASIGRKVTRDRQRNGTFGHGTVVALRTGTVSLKALCLSEHYTEVTVTAECCNTSYTSDHEDDLEGEHNIHYYGNQWDGSAGPDAWMHSEGECPLDMYGFKKVSA